MKKTRFSWSLILLAGFTWACNNETNSRGTTGTETDTVSNADTAAMMGDASSASPAAPLTAADSIFVMEAASGGLMEVELGQMAQQKATNPRVKMFGEMMVRDHSNANNQLKSLASQNNVSLPDSMTAMHRKHVEAMRKMEGKSFEQHYISMMPVEHQKDISKFQTASNSAHPGIKTFATAQLPVLQMHLDSAQAINKAIK